MLLAGGEMDNVRKATQAYTLAPWRRQVQVAVIFLVALTFLAWVAVVYLNVTARAVTMGSEIQWLQTDAEKMARENQDMESQLAHLTSALTLEERAKELGFKEVKPGKIIYLDVPGYAGRQPLTMAPPPQPMVVEKRSLSPEFTQSLIDWLNKNIVIPVQAMAETLP
jgi:cell division protein FtsL